MVDFSRRGLLLGLGASLLCAPAIVRAPSLMRIFPERIPYLYPDGSLDSTDALQAMINGKPYRIAGSAEIFQQAAFSVIMVPNGRYRVSHTLRTPATADPQMLQFGASTLEASCNPVLEHTGHGHLSIHNLCIESPNNFESVHGARGEAVLEFINPFGGGNG